MNYAILLAASTYVKMNMANCSFPLLGKPMIEYLVDSMEKTSVDKILCVIDKKNNTDTFDLFKKVNYVSQEELSTRLFATKAPLIEEDYTVLIPGNMPFLDHGILEGIIKEHKYSRNDFTLGTTQKEASNGYGMIERNKNEEIKVVSKQNCNQENSCNSEYFTGIACIRNSLLAEVLEQLRNSGLMDVLNYFSDHKRLGLFTITEADKVYQITDLYSLSCVEEKLRSSINKKHMLNGVCILNPLSTTISYDSKVEAGTIIHPGCNILGKTSIGKNCIIGPNTELKNAVLEDEVTCVHSVVSDSTISKNAYVGPFAHIRSNSLIGMGNRIGNFVEIKNSILGTRTDVAHLTYIGDTSCGDYVNWGCGCVTVNYDGQNKNKTIVGNYCFIGCNTNLIAPIVIGDHSFIAAGSTIDTNVEAGDFAIARARQINKKDYAKKYNFK